MIKENEEEECKLENRNRFQACILDKKETRNLKQQGYLISNENQFWKIRRLTES